MPPRYAYWTILIDGKATAFRAREREELLPTLNQLARKNPDVVMRYFSRGKLWDSPDQATWATENVTRPHEPRGHEWRPGGTHADPRTRFAREKAKKTADWKAKGGKSAGRKPADRRPPDRKPTDWKFSDRKPEDRRPSERKLPGGPRQTGERPLPGGSRQASETKQADNRKRPGTWKPTGNRKPR